jgi:hypothetical protein
MRSMSRTSRLILGAAVLVHLVLLAGWLRPALLAPLFFDVTVTSGTYAWDFNALYEAGANFLHGVDVYNTTPGERVEAVPYFTPFRYLPVAAYTVGATLNLLPPALAYRAWVAFTELALLACVYVTWKLVDDPNLRARLVAMWLAFTPYYVELMFGQFSFVQGALVFAMMALVLADRCDWRFDAAWITSVLWKLNTALFLPLMVRLGRWRTLAVLAVLLYLTTIPYFRFFPEGLPSFQSNFASAVNGHELGNHGLRQLLYETVLVVRPDLTGGGQTLQLAVVGLVVLLSLALTFVDPGPDVVDQLCLWLAAFFLISHQVWEHHYTMLLPVLVVVYWRTRSRWVAVCYVLLALPTPFWPTGLSAQIAANHDLRSAPLNPAWAGLLYHAAKPLPALALYAFLAWRIGRRGDWKSPVRALRRAPAGAGAE